MKVRNTAASTKEWKRLATEQVLLRPRRDGGRFVIATNFKARMEKLTDGIYAAAVNTVRSHMYVPAIDGDADSNHKSAAVVQQPICWLVGWLVGASCCMAGLSPVLLKQAMLLYDDEYTCDASFEGKKIDSQRR